MFYDISLDANNFFIYYQEAAEHLPPRLEIILQHLMCAFGKYQVFSGPFHVVVHLYMIMMRYDNGCSYVEASIMFPLLLFHFIPILPLVRYLLHDLIISREGISELYMML